MYINLHMFLIKWILFAIRWVDLYLEYNQAVQQKDILETELVIGQLDQSIG